MSQIQRDNFLAQFQNLIALEWIGFVKRPSVISDSHRRWWEMLVTLRDK